jgi:hypothetical protein
MNIGSVDPNFTGSRAIAGAGNAQPTIDLEIFGTTKGVLLPKDAKPKIAAFGAVTYKTLMLYNSQVHSLM